MLETDPSVINPEELVSRVRQRLAKTEPQGGGVAVGAEREAPSKDRQLLLENLRHLQANWQISAGAPITSHRRWIGRLIVFAKKAVRKVLRWYVEGRWGQQVGFNGAVTRAISDLSRMTQTDHVQIERLSHQLQLLQQDHQQPLSQLRVDFDNLHSRLDAFQQHLERIQADQVHLGSKMGKRLQVPAEGARAAASEPASEPSESSSAGFQLDYVLFENRFRGSREAIKERSRFYLEYFQHCLDGKAKILDIGCGRGEMIELFLEQRCDVLGVDLDGDMVESCTDRGLPVIKGDGIAYLEQLEDNSLGGVFLSQVIEHLTTAQLFHLLQVARQKLQPNGCIVMETINPKSFYALSNAFYMDLSHVRPVHPDTLEFVAQAAGYHSVKSVLLSPHPSMHRPLPDDATGHAVRELIGAVFGHQDYALIAYK